MQRAGQDVNYLGHKRSQIVEPIADRDDDDNWYRQTVPVLLVRDPLVNCDQRVESVVRGKVEQGAVGGSGPSHLRDGTYLVTGWKGRSQPPGHRLVKQQPHLAHQQESSWHA